MPACNRDIPKGTLVLTQTPAVPPQPSDNTVSTGDATPSSRTSSNSSDAAPTTIMDERYPAGSRVVLLTPPFSPGNVRELSRGFAAAGDPCVSWDGQWIYFAGKRSADGEWQIYKAGVRGGTPEQLTRLPGGAMDPAIAAHGELVFSSPVPKAGRAMTSRAGDSRPGALLQRARSPEPVTGESAPHPGTTAIYGQLPGKPPVRFTYGPDDAFNPTVLRDGRILFVAARPGADRDGSRPLCLFAMNNDGTEVTAYAGQDDDAGSMFRPRELGDGRIAFLARRDQPPGDEVRAESVRSAAPFATRGPLLSFATNGCRSIEWTSENDLLVCLPARGYVGRAMGTTTAIYRLAPEATEPGAPLFDDPNWHSVEATPVAPRPEPQGHTTALMPSAKTGTILCLNVNDSSLAAAGGTQARATRLRVFSTSVAGNRRELGSAPVAADGSVLVRLPVKVPLGFETLDADGNVLRHQPAFVWLQPGENRGCVGCHERRNHAPVNARPLAAAADPMQLDFGASSAATPRTSAP